MAKAKPDHTPDLPLDDPRWLPLITAHHLRSEQVSTAKPCGSCSPAAGQ
jgi:hypothetical protein